MAKLDELKSAIGPKAALEADCDRCPLARGRLVAPELSSVPSRNRYQLAVVGEAPGSKEIAERRPFIGASGKVMMSGLAKTCELSRTQVHWSNAVLCSTKHGGMPKNQELIDARAACENRLLAELEDHKDTVVAAVGAESLQSLLGRRKQVLRWRGTIGAKQELTTNFPQVAISRSQLLMPLLHPAFVFRAPQWKQTFMNDLARLGRVLADGFTPPEEQPGRSLLVTHTVEEWDAAVARMVERENTFDVETDRKEALLATLVCFGISDTQTSIVVPWKELTESKQAQFRQRVNALFARRVIVTHNGPSFDHLVAERYGLKIDQWDDTLIMVHSIESHLPKNLQSAVSRYADVPPWKELEDRKATLDRLYKYNGRDALYDALLWRALKQAA